MEIRNLENTSIKEIVECLLDAFSEYPVAMPSDPHFWKERWHIARVDRGLSYGVFDKERLLAFIMNGIDKKGRHKIAFNAGTGVRSEARNKKWPFRMYKHSIPILKSQGVSRCELEVISSNKRAIHVYEQIGFKKIRKIDCFKGDIELKDDYAISVERINFDEFKKYRLDRVRYSWDFDDHALAMAKDKYSFFKITAKSKLIGAFAIDELSGMLAQLYVLSQDDNHFDLLAKGIKSISNTIKINNIDTANRYLIDNLKRIGLNNHVSQYEMGMDL